MGRKSNKRSQEDKPNGEQQAKRFRGDTQPVGGSGVKEIASSNVVCRVNEKLKLLKLEKFCFVCCIKLPGIQDSNAHYASKRHKTRENKWLENEYLLNGVNEEKRNNNKDLRVSNSNNVKMHNQNFEQSRNSTGQSNKSSSSTILSDASSSGIIPTNEERLYSIYKNLQEKIKSLMTKLYCTVCKKKFDCILDAKTHYQHTLPHIHKITKRLCDEMQSQLDVLQSQGVTLDLRVEDWTQSIIKSLIFPEFCYICWYEFYKNKNLHYDHPDHRQRMRKWTSISNKIVTQLKTNNPPSDVNLLKKLDKNVLNTTTTTQNTELIATATNSGVSQKHTTSLKQIKQGNTLNLQTILTPNDSTSCPALDSNHNVFPGTESKTEKPAEDIPKDEAISSQKNELQKVKIDEEDIDNKINLHENQLLSDGAEISDQNSSNAPSYVSKDAVSNQETSQTFLSMDVISSILQFLETKIHLYINDNFCKFCNKTLTGERQAERHCVNEEHVVNICGALVEDVERGQEYLMQNNFKADIDWTSEILDIVKTPAKCFICWKEIGIRYFQQGHYESDSHNKWESVWKYFLNGRNLKEISQHCQKWCEIEAKNSELSKSFSVDQKAEFSKLVSLFSCEICDCKLELSSAWGHYSSRRHENNVKKWHKQQQEKLKEAQENDLSKTNHIVTQEDYALEIGKFLDTIHAMPLDVACNYLKNGNKQLDDLKKNEVFADF